MSNTESHARKRLGRCAGTLVAALTALAGISVVAPTHASAELIGEQNFRGDQTVPGVWTTKNLKGTYQPCLTAATSPPAGSLPACNEGPSEAVGEGAFRLTSDGNQQAGTLVLNRPISTSRGLHLTFDLLTYGGVAVGNPPNFGDGTVFFLVDGAQDPVEPGLPGGSLGYAGMKGAILGIGFDQFGNFSYGAGGPGRKPEQIVLRGAEATGYQYIQGIDAGAGLGAATREESRRSVTLDINTRNIMSLYVDFHDGTGRKKLIDKLHLDDIPGQPKLPATLKGGWSAATGDATAFHEVQDAVIATLDPDLALKAVANGEFQKGEPGSYTLTVSNGLEDGPTNGTVTTTFTIPDGLTYKAAAGAGWTCSAEGQLVTCTRPGIGDDALQPGSSYPAINVEVDVLPTAPDSVEATGKVETALEHNPENNTATVTVPLVAADPDVKIELTQEGAFSSGGAGTVNATVTNSTSAGATTGPTTITVPAPEGATINTAAGEGWTCTIAEDKATVTCTRPEALKSGESFPPVAVTFDIPESVKGPLTVTATVDAANDTNVADNTATTTAELTSPDLTVKLEGELTCAICVTGKITAVVSNLAGKGPTAGTVTVTIPAPARTTVTEAAGEGWTCTVEKTGATCTRPGIGDDALQAGDSYPEIVLTTTTEPMVVSATVTTRTDENTMNNTASTALGAGETPKSG